MFRDVLFAAQPVSFPRLGEDSLLDRMAGDFFEDEVMDALMEPWRPDRDLVFGHRAWVKPRPRWCPYTCVVTPPRRPTPPHVMILPRLASDTTPSGDCMCGKGTSDSSKTKAKEQSSVAGRKRTVSASSVSSENSVSSVKNTSTNNNNSTDTGKAGGGSPWEFSVDMKGCDEVRARSKKGMLIVEGRGSSDNSRQMVLYITSLPRHVNHDSLTASLNNGHLTVTQKGEAQLEGQARSLPIDTQEKEAPESTKQQKQHSEVKEQVQGAKQSRNVAAA